MVSWESHDQDPLNEQERDSQEPVNIAVSFGPRVEDTDIVVASDGSHQARDAQSSAELVVHIKHLKYNM